MKLKKSYKTILTIILFIGFLIYTVINSGGINKLKAQIKEVEKQESKEIVKGETNGNLKIYYFDVGQADSIFIKNNDSNMLIDAGNNEDGSKLVYYLKNNLNINHFDYVIGTHAHEDHIGGMDDIINNFKIDNFYMPNVITTTKTFEDVLNSLENNNLSINTPSIGDDFKLGEASIKILYTGTNSNNFNDTSIVLKLTYKSNSFLFMGDASSQVEKKLLNDDIKSDVLKIGHHGSEYSSTSEFLQKVNPTYAIISVGKSNVYGHPNFETLNKLNKKNIKIYRTDIDGTVEMISDGITISFKTLKTDLNG